MYVCKYMLVRTHGEETDGQKVTNWETTDIKRPKGSPYRKWCDEIKFVECLHKNLKLEAQDRRKEMLGRWLCPEKSTCYLTIHYPTIHSFNISNYSTFFLVLTSNLHFNFFPPMLNINFQTAADTHLPPASVGGGLGMFWWAKQTQQ